MHHSQKLEQITTEEEFGMWFISMLHTVLKEVCVMSRFVSDVGDKRCLGGPAALELRRNEKRQQTHLNTLFQAD